jgi:hypothetical protein
MKKIVILIILVVFSTNIIFSQQQKGDINTEISGLIYYADAKEYSLTEAFIMGGIGYFITDNISLGISPYIYSHTFEMKNTLDQTNNQNGTMYVLGPYFSYSILFGNSKLVPDLGVQINAATNFEKVVLYYQLFVKSKYFVDKNISVNLGANLYFGFYFGLLSYQLGFSYYWR